MYHKASQRHLSERFRSCKTYSDSIRSLLSPSYIWLQWHLLQCSPAMQRKSQLGKVSEPQEHVEVDTTYSVLFLCALQQVISQVPAPGHCAATTKFTEEVHTPSWAYSSCRRGGVCQPSRLCFSFPHWQDNMPRGVLWCSVLGMGAKISIPNLKALQITEPYPSFSQDQDLQGMLTLEDQFC